jgi:hypothetical protein
MKKQKKPTRSSPARGSSQSNRSSDASSGKTGGMAAFFQNTRLQSILIFTLGFLLYVNTLGNQWAQDDTVVITNNMLTKQGIAGVGEIFSNDSFYGYVKISGKADLVSGGRYRPLTIAMFAVLYEIVGQNPFLFHFITVLLFALTCLLLYRTLLLLLHKYKGQGYPEMLAWMTAVLFAVHPVHTEVAANIKGCDEIVTMLGSLGALFFTLRAVDTGKSKYGIYAAVSLFLGLLAKENTVTFLAVIPLALYYFRDITLTQQIKAGIPLLVAFVLFFAIRSAVLPELFSKPPMELMNNPYVKWTGDRWIEFSGGEKYGTIIYTLGQYIKLLIAPITLTHDYYPRHVDIMHFGDLRVMASLLLHLFLAGYALWRLRSGKRDVISFGILFYLITLSIVSNVVFPIGTNMGERFLFMPSIGFCLVASVLLLQLARAKQGFNYNKMAIPLGILAVVSVAFSLRTVLRNRDWFDNKTLVFKDISTSPNSAKVQSVCGMITCNEGIDEKEPVKKAALLQSSVDYNTRALEIHPTHKSALLNRGVCYYHLGKYDEAIADQRRVVNLAPSDPKGRINLSMALGGKGKYYEDEQQDLDNALKVFTESIALDSSNEETMWHLGTVNAKRANYAESIKWFKRLTTIRPNDPIIWGGLEWAYSLSGDSANAAACKQKAAQLTQQPTETK